VSGRIRFSVHYWLWGWIYWEDIYDQWVGPYQTILINWLPEVPYWWDHKLWVGYFQYDEFRVYDWRVFLPSNDMCRFVYLPVLIR